MATFHVLEPEVAGGLGEASVLDHSSQPPTVIHLDYEFMVWLGDDLVEANPCFIVTDRLATALKDFAGTGYTFDDLTVSKDEQFDEVHPGLVLPRFWRMTIHGKAGVDDAGLRLKDQTLVVSDRLLALLRIFKIDNCLVRKKPFQVQGGD
ncbi:MAG: hypothetical protein HYR84_13745 [Planctomycetes bacterium]|nr:hypothetical protein [Planctomycetota bacterium]